MPSYLVKPIIQVFDLRVTTIEQFGNECGNEFCDGCEAPCCGKLGIPLLTEAEFFSNRYPIKLIDVPELAAKNMVGLAIENGKCVFLKDNKCIIYDDRPQACKNYNCREDPKAEDFVKKRFG